MGNVHSKMRNSIYIFKHTHYKKACLKICVFKEDLKILSFEIPLRATGKAFQSFGPATAKALSVSFVLTFGTTIVGLAALLKQ